MLAAMSKTSDQSCIVVNIACILQEMIKIQYNENCINRNSMWQTFVFGIHRCSVYTSELKNISYFRTFGLYQISVYSGFGLNKFHAILSAKECQIVHTQNSFGVSKTSYTCITNTVISSHSHIYHWLRFKSWFTILFSSIPPPPPCIAFLFPSKSWVPDEGHSRNASCAVKLISRFLFQSVLHDPSWYNIRHSVFRRLSHYNQHYE
jgi:hypothetical protein